MDGFDIVSIDEIDQDLFERSTEESEDEETNIPLPEFIGIDSAVQDEEEVRLKGSENKPRKLKTRSETEREMELNVLKPDSIRRQILKKSLDSGNNKVGHPVNDAAVPGSSNPNEDRAHVMNIVEKAGMKGIDKERINEIIHEASKGSLFYKRQAQRQEEIHRSIEKMLKKVEMATPTQVANAKMTCDKMVSDIEKQRVYNRVIVHFDLDMFFAAVEIRDNPELKDKPIAVGGDSMVSTSNYIARRYGVRAAMPGFIAKKLCPDLILIKPNGFKYRQASSEIFSILEMYDPELTSMSLDEAYLDLTEYVKNTLERDSLDHEEYYDGTLSKDWWNRASEVVKEIRDAIYEKTKLTCSAGISCNTLLAKISTDINKPNGQFMVEGYPKDVIDFIQKTPVGKVSGIGKVSGQFLNALDIKTCGDLYEKRHYLPLVFYDINVKFYLRVALGDGSTCIKSDEQRKSKSVERTFVSVKDPLILLDKLDSICEELCTKYLKPYRIRGRTVTIKLKRNTFTTTTKSHSLLVPTNDKLVIYSASKNLLMAEIANEPPEISYRLLGVKLSNLADDSVTTNQLTIDAMLRNQELDKSKTKSDDIVYKVDDIQNARETDVDINSEQSIVDPDFEATDLHSRQANDDALHSSSGLKRKRPATVDIIDPFKGTCDAKHIKSSHKDETDNSCNSNGLDKVEKPLIVEDRADDCITEFNEQSQREQSQNDPNNEDFQCPYCFKSYSDFNNLEIHVNECSFKISIDVNKSFYSQKTSDARQNGIEFCCNSSQEDSVKKKALISQTQPSRKVRGRKQTNSISSYMTTKSPVTPTLQSNASNEPKTPKLSYYQKFIESNSQILSQTPKVDPFQCPFCTHGFITFKALENHVIVCTKNTHK